MCYIWVAFRRDARAFPLGFSICRISKRQCHWPLLACCSSARNPRDGQTGTGTAASPGNRNSKRAAAASHRHGNCRSRRLVGRIPQGGCPGPIAGGAALLAPPKNKKMRRCVVPMARGGAGPNGHITCRECACARGRCQLHRHRNTQQAGAKYPFQTPTASLTQASIRQT